MAVMMSGCMEYDDTKAIEDTPADQIAPEEPTSTPAVTPTPNKPKSGIPSPPLTATFDGVGGDCWVILYEDGSADVCAQWNSDCNSGTWALDTYQGSTGVRYKVHYSKSYLLEME